MTDDWNVLALKRFINKRRKLWPTTESAQIMAQARNSSLDRRIIGALCRGYVLDLFDGTKRQLIDVAKDDLPLGYIGDKSRIRLREILNA